MKTSSKILSWWYQIFHHLKLFRVQVQKRMCWSLLECFALQSHWSWFLCAPWASHVHHRTGRSEVLRAFWRTDRTGKGSSGHRELGLPVAGQSLCRWQCSSSDRRAKTRKSPPSRECLKINYQNLKTILK